MHKTRHDIVECFALPEAIWKAEDWGDMHVSFETYHQAFDDRRLLEDMPDGNCPCPHWGYVMQGRVRVFYADHEEEIVAGEAYYLAPGHAIAVDAGTELIEFSPKDAFAELMSGLTRIQSGK